MCGAAVVPRGAERRTLLADEAPHSPDPWSEVPRILSRIRPPQFPERDFDIRKFGAAGDNRTDCTDAFRKAIAACSGAGGGRVVVPAGAFLTGAIRLLSGVNLHLLEGATLRFSQDPHKYPLVLTRWEGTELMNFSPLIYAFAQKDIAITGHGTIDGNSDEKHWWPWKGAGKFGWKAGVPNQAKDREALEEMGANGIPVSQRIFGEGHFLRPPLIQPYRCVNVLIDGVSLINSPMWHLHPVLCTNVTVRGLTIRSDGPNTDGCDPESCRDVLIRECLFDTGDDCIAIKSGRDADGRRLHTPAENIVIQGSRMKRGHGAITVGSEISGGVRSVFAEDCIIEGPGLLDVVRIKNNALRGGKLEDIYARRLRAGQVTDAGLSIDDHYEDHETAPYIPVIRRIEIRRLVVGQAGAAIVLRGLQKAPIEDVRLVDCEFQHVERPNVVEHVSGLVLRDVRINGKLAAGAADSGRGG